MDHCPPSTLTSEKLPAGQGFHAASCSLPSSSGISTETGYFRRVWAMPSADTFSVPPLGDMVKRYLRNATVSVDPCARNKRWATYTNDINPNTEAEYHMEARAFLAEMVRQGIAADLIIFDPPYSPRPV